MGNIEFDGRYVDELIDMRRQSRIDKDWSLSDNIRDYLDTKHIFVFDHKEGQEVFHRSSGTRASLIEEISREARAEKLFDSWLFTAKSKL